MSYHENDGPLIVCRLAPPKETLLAGGRLGYNCEMCKVPLQITAGGAAIAEENPGARLLCNFCGLLFVHVAEADGEPVAHALSPTAKAQMDEGNNSLMADWVRKHIA